jgi:hypothetical protein
VPRIRRGPAACGRSLRQGRCLGNPERLTEAVSASDAQIWNFRAMERRDLVDYARRRLQRQLSQRGTRTEIVAAARLALDPNVLTLGFARRFTEYKRPAMLLSQPERLMKLLTDTERPVQLIIAGKAHPADEPGHAFVQRWAQFVQNVRCACTRSSPRITTRAGEQLVQASTSGSIRRAGRGSERHQRHGPRQQVLICRTRWLVGRGVLARRRLGAG